MNEGHFPDVGSTAIRTYHSDADEYAMHQRREGGYLIDINLGKLASMTPDQLEQVMLHEVAHSAENAFTTWDEYVVERDALLSWTPKVTRLPQSTGSSTIELALRKAGFSGEIEYDELYGKITLYERPYEIASTISNYAVRKADPGTQDSELLAESIRYIANNGFGDNRVADAIARESI